MQFPGPLTHRPGYTLTYGSILPETGRLDRWFRFVKESIVCEWWNADKKPAFELVLTIIVQLLQCPPFMMNYGARDYQLTYG